MFEPILQVGTLRPREGDLFTQREQLPCHIELAGLMPQCRLIAGKELSSS